MRTKCFFMCLAAMLLTSVCAFAQSGNQPLKGDVNEDGKVDVSDIVAVVNIILNGGSTPQPAVTYYWYVGQTNPTAIDTIVDDNDMSSPGWRRIGTSLPTYSSSNMLWNGDTNNIIFENRDYYYIAVPNESIKIYNAANGSVMDSFTNITTKDIGGVLYYIYPCNSKARSFVYNIF